MAETDPDWMVRQLTGWIATISGGLTLASTAFSSLAMFGVPLSIVFTVWWLVLHLKAPQHRLRRERRRRLYVARTALSDARTNFAAVAERRRAQFQEVLRNAQNAKKEHETIGAQRREELQELQLQAVERQREEYLRQVFISNARIPGIGPIKLAVLESYGIETAYDVTYQRVMAVPGFKEKLTARLMVWKQQVESRFRFDPSKGVPPSYVLAVEGKYHQRRFRAEQALRDAPRALLKISLAGKSELERLDRGIARREADVARATADLRSFR